ncbi:Protein of unknown function [Desulfotomaculum arcticum]|uniref:DUF3486 family protein n=1 Tax=Desulfotruncus arcticus DSM 17038 TaxID=1121424 RepID=A0A1I2Y730_9FIRM|nr:phage protein Gp27 family protein [Desulfotruncus arcticus]SFH21520.1 Protein of unknown function [Desulfotomaculum arcticum] [Desulfotruncus arcticus DSM 17038]
MGEQRQRTRTRSKVDELPEELKLKVEAMLLDTNNTYNDISEHLKSEGYDISKSAIGRYALRTNHATQRLLEAQEQTRMLIEAIKKNPDADYTEGALQIMSGELTKKLAQAQEEWDEMPLDKAARVMVALSRTKVYKDRIRADLAQEAKIALAEFKKEVYAELEGVEPELCERLIQVANRVAERLEAEES